VVEEGAHGSEVGYEKLEEELHSQNARLLEQKEVASHKKQW
jgi:hypothetical protein